MNYLLRAMGLWIWGLIAIAISVSLVSISYRTISAYHQHYAFDASSPDAGSSAELRKRDGRKRIAPAFHQQDHWQGYVRCAKSHAERAMVGSFA